MLFDLLFCGFTRVNRFLDRLDLGVVARLDIDLFVLTTVYHIEEPIAVTRVLLRPGAELFATFTRA